MPCLPDLLDETRAYLSAVIEPVALCTQDEEVLRLEAHAR